MNNLYKYRAIQNEKTMLGFWPEEFEVYGPWKTKDQMICKVDSLEKAELIKTALNEYFQGVEK